MKIKFLLTLLFFAGLSAAYGQKTVQLTKQYGSSNKDLQNLMNFENIYFEKLSFTGKAIRSKSYRVTLKEFTDGKLTDSAILFDGTESDFFKVQSDSLSVKFAFKLEEDQLKVQVFGAGFGSKKSYFPLKSSGDRYAMKDFFGSKDTLKQDPLKTNAVFAVITPTLHPDGSGSYCEVAQYDIAPEALGRHSKIPHYFVVYITFR
ncbi:hypothetical protein SAMN05192529_13712 [Arachidicoccus rhizosphaerae]|uniref:Uncharacterized protein n=1 Tax=Arachidicoccus rhizosphaerae TaxID=551991 RepID=A0A1H4CUV4_9BACT|nr:hypothetical protein [Arachidicoccus rhizosphaerae]SEA64108.1 hypothetical protein SAMN05192529_13712 [Arachidicoccus rhizosphaerae]